MLDKSGVERLLSDINKKTARPLADNVLATSFERNYPQLRADLASIQERDYGTHVAPRTGEDKISEILTLTREIIGKLPEAFGDGSTLSRPAIPSLSGRSLEGRGTFTRRMVEAMVLDQLNVLSVDPDGVTLSWPAADLLRIRTAESLDGKKEKVIKELLQRQFPSLDFDVRKPVLPPRAVEALRQADTAEA